MAFLSAALCGTAAFAFPALASLSPLGRVACITAAVLFMAASGLGVGYAFWVGALLLGILQGMGLEEIVNYLSEGTQRDGSLWAATALVAGAVLSAALADRGVPGKLAAWISRRFGTSGFPLTLAGLASGFLPRAGGRLHSAGEGLNGRLPAGADPWIEPATRLLWPWAPVFLAACVLYRLPAGPAWLLFLSLLMVAAAASAWTRPGPADGSSIPEPENDGSPEGFLWGLLPLAAIPWGIRGLGIAAVLGAVAGLVLMGGTLRARLRFAWEAVTIDLVVLVAGVVAYGAMLEGGRAGEAFLPFLEDRELLGLSGVLAAFAASSVFAACGGALTGIALLAPVAQALSFRSAFTPPWLAAIVGGALCGELLRTALWNDARERGGWLRTAGILALVAAASLFPGLLNVR